MPQFLRIKFAADFALPSAVFGPVESPPCSLQRPFANALHWHKVFLRVLASQRSPGTGLFRAASFAERIRAISLATVYFHRLPGLAIRCQFSQKAIFFFQRSPRYGNGIWRSFLSMRHFNLRVPTLPAACPLYRDSSLLTVFTGRCGFLIAELQVLANPALACPERKYLNGESGQSIAWF